MLEAVQLCLQPAQRAELAALILSDSPVWRNHISLFAGKLAVESRSRLRGVLNEPHVG